MLTTGSGGQPVDGCGGGGVEIARSASNRRCASVRAKTLVAASSPKLLAAAATSVANSASQNRGEDLTHHRGVRPDHLDAVTCTVPSSSITDARRRSCATRWRGGRRRGRRAFPSAAHTPEIIERHRPLDPTTPWAVSPTNCSPQRGLACARANSCTCPTPTSPAMQAGTDRPIRRHQPRRLQPSLTLLVRPPNRRLQPTPHRHMPIRRVHRPPLQLGDHHRQLGLMATSRTLQLTEPLDQRIVGQRRHLVDQSHRTCTHSDQGVSHPCHATARRGTVTTDSRGATKSMSSRVNRAAENSSVLRRAASPRARNASGSAISSRSARDQLVERVASVSRRRRRGRSPPARRRRRRPARRRRPSPRRGRCRSARSGRGGDASSPNPGRARRARPRRAAGRRARPAR